MTKKQYIEFCSGNPDVPVFSHGFWLDAVSDHWEVAVHTEKGKVLGVLPYCLKGHLLTKRIYIPELTPYSGPVLFYPEKMNEYDRRSFEKKVLSNLIDQLPDKIYKASIKCYPEIDNWLPFYWKGFKQTGRYTYLLDTAHSTETLFSNLKDAHQRQIRKAEKAKIAIKKNIDETGLFDLFAQTFVRQKTKTPFTKDPLENIYTAVKQSGGGEIFVAQNRSGELLAAMFVVWDRKTMYYLLGYFDDEQANSGAMTYLFWHCIQLAKEKKLSFNFEGSMIEGIEQYFRGFGGKLTPVHFLTK